MNSDNEKDELKSIIQEGDVHKTNNGEKLVFNPFNPNNKETRKTTSFSKNIIFENVSFTFKNKEKNVLKNINLEILKGEKIDPTISCDGRDILH